jgi:hypothetical protein
MHQSCPATPAGLGSTRSRGRATGCENANRLTVAARFGGADSHRRFRSERPLRSSRTLFRSLVNC